MNYDDIVIEKRNSYQIKDEEQKLFVPGSYQIIQDYLTQINRKSQTKNSCCNTHCFCALLSYILIIAVILLAIFVSWYILYGLIFLIALSCSLGLPTKQKNNYIQKTTNNFQNRIYDYYTVKRNYNNSFCTLTPRLHHRPIGYRVVQQNQFYRGLLMDNRNMQQQISLQNYQDQPLNPIQQTQNIIPYTIPTTQVDQHNRDSFVSMNQQNINQAQPNLINQYNPQVQKIPIHTFQINDSKISEAKQLRVVNFHFFINIMILFYSVKI